MARTPKRQYDPTTSEAVKALIDYHDQAVAHLSNPMAPMPDPTLLTKGLPQGSIEKVEVVGDPASPAIAFTIKERPARTMPPEAAFSLRTLGLFEGGAIFIDKNSANPDERLDYLEVGANQGITAQRLWADARAGEMVKLRDHHHNLQPAALAIVNGPEGSVRGRREAIAEALKAYDKNAVAWGLAGLLSRDDYRTMLRTAFKLFDIKHGHNFLRRIAKD